MPFLHEIFNNPFAKKALSQVQIPSSILDNLAHSIRPYQLEAFKRYIYIDMEDLDEKPKKPFHLLYNMATGSGKTLVMAGLMLYLYQKGYRNFLFFVNSNNIVKKTKGNFLNTQSSKYLFTEKITIDGKEIFIKEADIFDNADESNINIKFTTIQQLHGDLNKTKENSITYDDFKNKKIVLMADEAHHLSSATRGNGELFGSWEGTVVEVLKQNLENLLLEFTATLDYDSAEITNKYQDKVLFKYDLAQFRVEKYSKEISLIRSEFNQNDRIIQALVLNLYRQELATANSINLKPVILFKAKKTIAESQQNKQDFHKLINGLTGSMIKAVKVNSTIPVIIKAFDFFEGIGLNAEEIKNRIQFNFKETNCLSANESETTDKKKKAEGEKSDELLNTLENENNPIRAIFAVQKLNEGWDVLNLFDIVRLYEGQNTGGTNTTVGATTLSEAQLIGRGARYYPFALEAEHDKFTRKYDDDQGNDLKVLEELYYHTKEDNRYISELKKALIASGIYEDEDNLITKKLSLKPEFMKTNFYTTGKVVFNKKVATSNGNIKKFTDLVVAKQNYIHTLSSGRGKSSVVFNVEEDVVTENIVNIDINLLDIPKHIIRFALSENPYFDFNKIVKFFPNIGSTSNFINSQEYIGGLKITFKGAASRFANINNADYLVAVRGLLKSIEIDIRSNLVEFEGSDYVSDYIHNIFKDKEIKVPKESERSKGQEEFVADKSWYVFNANYGTSEEKSFVELFARRFRGLEKKYEDIYLIRNEREIKIYDELGRAFEPDFLLFAKEIKGSGLTYQVFIEPKGEFLKGNDKWKEDFLIKIRAQKKTLKIETDQYLITGVPFYSYADENSFAKELEDTLDINI